MCSAWWGSKASILCEGVKGQGEKKVRDFGGFDREKGYHGTGNGSPTLSVWVGKRKRERERALHRVFSVIFGGGALWFARGQ